MSQTSFRYANTVNGICERITTNLNDDERGRENTRYPQSYLKALVMDTLKLFACLQPALFAEEVEVKVPANAKGVYTLDKEQCETLIDVTGVIDDAGRPVPVQDVEYSVLGKAAMYPSKRNCCSGAANGTSAMYSFARNPGNTDQFRMTPKVLPGTEITVCATCTNVKSFELDPDKEIKCEFVKMIPAVQQWVMYVAIMTKEPGAAADAAAHRAAFFDLVPWTVLAVEAAQRQRQQS